MPVYFYTAKSFKGETKTGTLEMENEKDLARALRQEGYVLVKVDSAKEKAKKNGGFDFLSQFKKVSLSEKIFFARNLQIMITAGMPLPRALRILSEQTKNKKFKKTILDIENNITKGQNLSDSLSRHPGIFSDLFVSMVKVGEESGTIDKVLKNLTYQMEREKELMTKIKSAMTYPLVILILMMLIGVAMMILVVPKLTAVFTEMNVELPFTTKFIMGMGGAMAKYWYLIILSAAVIFLLFKIISKSKSAKRAADGLILKIPVVSVIIKKINTATTARTLGSLIDAGVPIVRSLEIVTNTMGNYYYNMAMKKAAEEVQKGKKLSDSLNTYQNIYPSIMIQMIAIGEETGDTANILAKIADFYEEEVSNATKNLSSVIEPVLMVIIGVAVGFFAISMIQPMYSMMGSL